jgi:uncharacterized C2H2 Zn-finger protein
MGKIIRGTQGAKNAVVLREAEGGMRRLRCPKCTMLAVPVRLSSGETVHQCGGCGAQYKTTRL